MALPSIGVRAFAPSWLAQLATRSTDWTVEIVGWDRLAQLTEPSRPLAAPTGFQASAWLEAVYRDLAPGVGSTPLCAVLSGPNGSPVAAFALEVRREMGAAIARFADLGVCDYNAPLLGSAAGGDQGHLAAGWVGALARALPSVDVVSMERVYPGLLAHHPKALPARHSGNSLTVIDGVEAFIRSRGKKYRKEVERCYRVLSSEGAWRFERASTVQDVANAYETLERQQAERHAATPDYALGQKRFSTFYERVLLQGLATPTGAQIFTLTVDGAIIAVLLGVVHGTTFTLLRIANGGDRWRHVSPGRIIVVEAMRHFCPLGVTTFDMGIGDYAFKRGFGTQPVPLVDIVVATSARGLPYVAATRLKSHLRQNERLRAAVRRVRGSFSPSTLPVVAEG